MDNLKMILFDGTELSTDDRNPLPEHMRNGVFLHLICMPCPLPSEPMGRGVRAKMRQKARQQPPRPFSLPDERGIRMLMLAAAAIVLMFLILTMAAAREDERMGIRFEGEGVKHRDQS